MWRCPKCRSKVDDSFEVCWSCGTTADGIEDPNFVTADEADPIPDEKIPEGTEVDDPLADFAGTPMPALVECYMAGNTIEAKFIADQLMEQGIPAIADKIDTNTMPIGTIQVELDLQPSHREGIGIGYCTTRGVQDIGGGTKPLRDCHKMVV